jgi:hypothetical protein
MTSASVRAEDRTQAAGLEPEIIPPSQLLAGSRLDANAQPEKRLMLAVLEDAVACFQRGVAATSPAAVRDFDEVCAWFASDDLAWPYSFVNICHVLGFDPDYLRRGLERWLASMRDRARGEKVVPIRYAFRRISGSRTRAVVPRHMREAR